MLHDLGIGVLGSVIGTVVWIGISKIYLYIKFYKNSEYSGVWIDTIPPVTPGGEEKHDEIVVKHNKKDNTISGTIKRTAPHGEETERTWEMNGAINNGYFIASFWHDGPQKSNGCVYAKLTSDNRYEGYYLEEHNGTIDKTPITLTKKRNA